MSVIKWMFLVLCTCEVEKFNPASRFSPLAFTSFSLEWWLRCVCLLFCSTIFTSTTTPLLLLLLLQLLLLLLRSVSFWLPQKSLTVGHLNIFPMWCNLSINWLLYLTNLKTKLQDLSIHQKKYIMYVSWRKTLQPVCKKLDKKLENAVSAACLTVTTMTAGVLSSAYLCIPPRRRPVKSHCADHFWRPF